MKIFSGFEFQKSVFNEKHIGITKPLLRQMGFCDDCLSGLNPTLVMDRGIATAENVEMLKGEGFSYVLITKGPWNSYYLDQFKTAMTIRSSSRSSVMREAEGHSRFSDREKQKRYRQLG